MPVATRLPSVDTASNRMAKWYQNAMVAAPPINWDRMCAMPTARVGAPPVRDRIEPSPTSLAICVSASGVTTKPHWLITVAALSGVVPIRAAGLFMAKYTPGSSAQAAMSAMMATKLSQIIEP